MPEFDDTTKVWGAYKSAYFNRLSLPDVPQKYEDIASELMFKGGRVEGLSEKVDTGKATKAVKAWLCSFDVAHEAKITTVAYALWLWSDDDALSA